MGGVTRTSTGSSRGVYTNPTCESGVCPFPKYPAGSSPRPPVVPAEKVFGVGARRVQVPCEEVRLEV